MKDTIAGAEVIADDRRIEGLLAREDTVVMAAYACRFDGFANDTFTEYANPSIHRPDSVRKAKLQSTISATIYQRGWYYLGFTMYATAGAEEPMEIWVGHRQIAVARLPRGDNRVHLFVAPERTLFKGGEPIRLVTAETDGPYRVENLVLLPRKPRPKKSRLEIEHVHVDLLPSLGNGKNAAATWITNIPAESEVRYGVGDAFHHRAVEKTEEVNHQVMLEDLRPNATYRFQIIAQDTDGHEATYRGVFRTEEREGRGRIRRKSIPIHVMNQARAKMTSWPVTSGIPFRKGSLGEVGHLRVLRDDGEEVPSQARALARWPDESVQWALIDFQADASAQEERVYQVEYGESVEPSPHPSPLEVAESEEGITVVTGPMKLEIGREDFCSPGSVSLWDETKRVFEQVTAENARPGIILVDRSGTSYTSRGAVSSLAVEEMGPERAVVGVEVPHRSDDGRVLFRSIFRIHAYRGKTFLRVFHTFENDALDEEFTHIQEMALSTELAPDGPRQIRIGRHRVANLEQDSVQLLQDQDHRYGVRQNGSEIGSGKRAEGWVHVSEKNCELTVAVRDFWQNYPKGLTVSPEGVQVQICPKLAPDLYPKGGLEEDRLFYHLLDGQYKFKRGVSRTHEIWYHFHRNELPEISPGVLNRLVQERT